MATSKHTHPDPFVLARDGDDASVEELAAIEFEPLPEDDRLAMYESLGNPRWNESAFNLSVALRLALAVMEKSKPDDCPPRWCGSAPIARYCVLVFIRRSIPRQPGKRGRVKTRPRSGARKASAFTYRRTRSQEAA